MMRASGWIKFFSDRGFGFVIVDGGGGEAFVHRSDLQESCRVDGELQLSPGDRVEFDVIDTGRGPRAVAVSREARDAAS